MIKDIVARGFGTFSSVGFVPTRGYSIGTVVASPSVIPFDIDFYYVRDASVIFAGVQVAAPWFEYVRSQDEKFSRK